MNVKRMNSSDPVLAKLGGLLANLETFYKDVHARSGKRR